MAAPSAHPRLLPALATALTRGRPRLRFFILRHHGARARPYGARVLLKAPCESRPKDTAFVTKPGPLLRDVMEELRQERTHEQRQQTHVAALNVELNITTGNHSRAAANAGLAVFLYLDALPQRPSTPQAELRSLRGVGSMEGETRIRVGPC